MSIELEATIRHGRYEARLTVGVQGRLRWSLPGPDLRYRWGSGSVQLAQVPRFKEQLVKAYGELVELRKVAPTGVEMRKIIAPDGRKFSIAVGGYSEGLAVFPDSENSYQCRIKTDQDLDAFLALLDKAMDMNIKLSAHVL
ncbi:hypothetical protein [Kineococcus terrestris]|uniref:hypothetical protein n=1 Tax=Kineococcus terrestris TaxID=2044856 RepID=UPI0034DAED56